MKIEVSRGRYTARRKLNAVLRSLREGEDQPIAAALGVRDETVKKWRETFIHGGMRALGQPVSRGTNAELRALTLALTKALIKSELLSEKCRRLSRGEPVDAVAVSGVAAQKSLTTARVYGIKPVAEAWCIPRSTIYLRRRLQRERARRRG